MLPGATSVTTYVVLRKTIDSTEQTAAVIANIGLTYCRSGQVASAKVSGVALSAANATHSDFGVFEIDSANQPGLYRIDWPNAAFAAGVREVILTVKYAGCFVEHFRMSLDTELNIWAYLIDSTQTAKNILRYLLSFIGCKASGGGTTAPVFRDVADTKPRISMTVDANGNRTAVTLDGTD